ncbi:hypothetical protein N7492_005090 [Penicillium capsulatum]|uniref:Uncharacterized protein n=1 Tax=Penicillium capsulatum TaxID=69766 RepID=A0A9W9LQU3_9EURO|nr:hypothetical protein N7492_005090 [Penicillium capsulatum]KAJ6135802.1 hypothetical protein N7512_000962 [Penicillium capsulatum]
MISKWDAKIKLKKEQIADLERRAQPDTAIAKDMVMNEDEPQDHDEDPSQSGHSDVGLDTFKKLVVWQIERHIQWASSEKQRPWTSISELCSVLDIRTAADLERDCRQGQGNLKLNPQYCRLPLYGTPWGRPAAALMDHANKVLEDPEHWILQDEARALLIAVENWYFSSPEVSRALILGKEDDKLTLPSSMQKKWEYAFANGARESEAGQTDTSSSD